MTENKHLSRKLRDLPRAIMDSRSSKIAGKPVSVFDSWPVKIIERNKYEPGVRDSRPFISYAFQKWWQVRWMIYLSRWVCGQIDAQIRFPLKKTNVDYRSGELLLVKDKESIIWKTPWTVIRND